MHIIFNHTSFTGAMYKLRKVNEVLEYYTETKNGKLSDVN